ncbi:MAG: hypothetical protein J6Y54_06135 [Lentisphaeria bacterium]|nr:hypothetical protein [Lentisphaeria bacterium]
MKKMLMCGLAALSLLGAGCVFSRNDYVEIVEFDLELPKRAENAPAVRIGVFKNLSGADRRFLLRQGDGQVVSLEYQRWRLAPELLLMRCIFGALDIGPDRDVKLPRLSAVIYRFEFDKRDEKAHLSVDFFMPDFRDPASAGKASQPHPVTIRCDAAVPVKKSGDMAAARAAAMSECARLAVEKLSAEMNAKTVRKADKK